MRWYSILLCMAWLLSSCVHTSGRKFSEEKQSELIAFGDSISDIVQNNLFQNVAAAIQEGGVDHAVSFCNTMAIPLTDSIADSYRLAVERLSERNRNSINALTTKSDSIAWEKISDDATSFVEMNDNGDVYYYRAIFTAMPTCLRCHGSFNEVEESTRLVIQEKYPEDKALGYKIGDLRGMWKIRLSDTN